MTSRFMSTIEQGRSVHACTQCRATNSASSRVLATVVRSENGCAIRHDVDCDGRCRLRSARVFGDSVKVTRCLKKPLTRVNQLHWLASDSLAHSALGHIDVGRAGVTMSRALLWCVDFLLRFWRKF